VRIAAAEPGQDDLAHVRPIVAVGVFEKEAGSACTRRSRRRMRAQIAVGMFRWSANTVNLSRGRRHRCLRK